jgi:hypothetical protein
MKIIFFFLMFPVMAWSVEIPLTEFDGSKLEQLLRKIPSAIDEKKQMNGFVRHMSSFPKSKRGQFKILCQADFYGTSQVPSQESCTLEVTDEDFLGDEAVYELTDSSAKTLINAIPYGAAKKTFNAHEKIWGQSAQGKKKYLFRYSFNCQQEKCSLSFVKAQ